MRLRQLVKRSDGTTLQRSLGDTLVYVVSETHAHWHFPDFDRYGNNVAATQVELPGNPEASAGVDTETDPEAR